MSNLRIRPATPADLPAINAIYNYYVRHSTATYQLEPDTDDIRARWFAAHGPKHPVIVADRNREILGWGSLSPFHKRAAYARTVEDSIYVRQGSQRSGIGSAILADLIERARATGHHTIIAGIDAEQQASLALHARFGFVEVGHLREVGNKFDRWLDVIYMQLVL